MKRIIFNLKKEWYDKIASGEKTVEYRNVTDHWASRLMPNTIPKSSHKVDICGNFYFTHMETKPLIPNDWFAVFRLGYSSKHPDIVCRIVKIDIGYCPYKGWDGEYFRVHFEKGVCAS